MTSVFDGETVEKGEGEYLQVNPFGQLSEDNQKITRENNVIPPPV